MSDAELIRDWDGLGKVPPPSLGKCRVRLNCGEKPLSICEKAHKSFPGAYFFKLGALKGEEGEVGGTDRDGQGPSGRCVGGGKVMLFRPQALESPWAGPACSGNTWG